MSLATGTLEKNTVDLKVSRVFLDILNAFNKGYRRISLEGGTYSTKTWSALQFIIVFAKEYPISIPISIVSESLPHLKKGCIADLFNILRDTPDNCSWWNKTECIYKRPDWKSHIEFFGANDSDKVRGPRRGLLFINEANNVPWEAADGLDMRTNLFTIADWNPLGEFWAHEKWLDTPEHPHPENAYSHSTYLDAVEVLPAGKLTDIEARKSDPNWWNVYGLGLLGKVEGLVYPYFEQCDSLPTGYYFYGLDYGYSSDPTALVQNVVDGDKLYSRQLIYKIGLTNDDIARELRLLRIGNEPIYADANEPKSAEELRQLGYNVQAIDKAFARVNYGHQRVNQYKQFWTRDSLDGIKEQRNFRYLKKQVQGQEQWTEDTTHQYSHLMSARRFAVAAHNVASSGLARTRSSSWGGI